MAAFTDVITPKALATEDALCVQREHRNDIPPNAMIPIGDNDEVAADQTTRSQDT